MTMMQVGLSLMPESVYLDATGDLFESGEVDIIEWSFDMCWGRQLPLRCSKLLQTYSDRNALLGHGVSFSLLTAKRTTRQSLWLKFLEKEVKQYNYKNISEHFGFLSTEKFTHGSPLSMPFIPELLTIGVNNLNQIKAIANVPIGLENLGFAFSKQDVIDQGKFLSALLESVDGFLVLDIHNIYCHMINFHMSFEEIIETLPIERAKEIHISGGSVRSIRHENKKIYCDSHDAAVPTDVFLLLEKHLQTFSTVEAVIFERLGHTLTSEDEVSQFHEDFKILKSLVKKENYAVSA